LKHISPLRLWAPGHISVRIEEGGDILSLKYCISFSFTTVDKNYQCRFFTNHCAMEVDLDFFSVLTTTDMLELVYPVEATPASKREIKFRDAES
jgi:hypothetical protein